MSEVNVSELNTQAQQLLMLPLKTLSTLLNEQKQKASDFVMRQKVLESARDKFMLSETALVRVSNQESSTPVLIPLTSQLYVKGKLANVKEVYVDIGTDYYVKRDVKGARSVLQRKITKINQYIKNLKEEEAKTRNQVFILNAVLQQKLRMSVQQKSQ